MLAVPLRLMLASPVGTLRKAAIFYHPSAMVLRDLPVTAK